MAEQGDSTNAVSSTPSNDNVQPTSSADQSLVKPHVVRFDDGHYEDDANDPEVLDPQSRKDEGYNQGNHDFRFANLEDMIEEHTAESAVACSSKKPYNSFESRELHNVHQRAIWQRIREQAKEDDNIPTALFSPPRTYIEVLVTKIPDRRHYCCPCDIDDDACEIIQIRAPKDSEDGITKDMFIQQVSDALYGRAPGENQDDGSDGYTIGGEDDRPVVKNLTYMIQGSKPDNAINIMGHIFALTKGIVPKAVRR
ncbi:hypothetical protein F4804DRAFT_86535 [Jackrogersella minutella]|nr:hypothetical protein F4804DRAFT_86535 [Jackrogersella minutella]